MQTTTDTAAATHSHTPGPWMWDDNTLRPANPNPDTSSVHSILDAEGGWGLMGSDVHKTCAELDADRVLIAAAPELLEALQRLHACMQAQDLEAEAKRPTEDEYQACMAAAAAAIAKATGQQGWCRMNAPKQSHGCCADKACSDKTCMELPNGKTCGHCVHERRCCMIFGHTPTDTYCDWFPRRFAEKPQQGAAA